MSTSTVKQLPKSTVEIEITIPWEDIKSTYEKIFLVVSSEMEVPGFRKGKAPKDLVEKRIDRSKIYEEVVKEVVPKAYAKAIQDHNLKPVVSPKIEVLKAKESEEWVVKATIALKPKVNLMNYQEKVKALKKGKAKIWVPGGNDKKPEEKKVSLDDLISTLIAETEIELSDILVTEEANRLLSNLIDQTQKLGLTVEQYLLSKGKTSEQLRAEYALQAAKNLKIEFILNEIADRENITVNQQDIDQLLSKVEKPEDRDQLKKDSYYLAHLIRQQKTLDFLNNL